MTLCASLFSADYASIWDAVFFFFLIFSLFFLFSPSPRFGCSERYNGTGVVGPATSEHHKKRPAIKIKINEEILVTYPV
jgi:hypothetical protein